jgi:predicted XRE-type DNA-binding protein
VREIRVGDDSGAYRVIYLATLADAVHVYHVFQKKTQKTPKRELEIARNRIPGTYAEPRKVTKTQTFADVWDAMEDTPGEAAAMRLRADIMIAITERMRAWNVTQREAAQRLGITQPRLNELLTGKINKFSLDALIALAQRAGIKVSVSIEKV